MYLLFSILFSAQTISLLCVPDSFTTYLTDVLFSSGAVGHHGDNLVEKILTVLRPLPGHVTDVQVDMLELTGLQPTPHAQTTLAPGCLAQTQ